MQLPQQLSSFWQRLAAFQRLSLISILFFLVVLPVAIWLALSPTSPFSRAGHLVTPPISGPITTPIPSIPPLPSTIPTGEINGPTSGRATEGIGPYTAIARGINLTSVHLYWVRVDSAKGTPWNIISANYNCNNASFCQTSGSFTPPYGGSYNVFVLVESQFGNCLGESLPTATGSATIQGGGPVSGPCGPKGQVAVSVTNPVITQTFNWSAGYNFIGLTVNKPNYKAVDFLRDANSSFVTTPPRPFAKVQGGGDILSIVYRFNQTTYNWEYYTSWGVGNNFTMRPGEGYVVKSTQEGASSIAGEGSALSSIQIGTRWSLISTDLGFPSAEGMLQAMQEQGIDARVIAKWNLQSGRYELKQIGVDVGDFPILPGAGYWARNEGAAKDFNLP